jgi:hypothetical protein
MLSLLLSLGAHADTAPRAFYEVPVEKDLAPYARYEIHEYGKAIKGDSIELSYQLPLELTGVPQVVTFSGKIVKGDEPYELEGANGKMSCSHEDAVLRLQSCRVKYHGVDVDLNEVAKVLRAQKLSPEAVDGKLRVAALFREGGGDIGGIITYLGLWVR